MKRISLERMHECQSHLRHAFSEFASLWQSTRAAWRDEPARQFEQRHLAELSPILKRVSAAAEEFAEQVRAAEQAISDPERDTEMRP